MLSSPRASESRDAQVHESKNFITTFVNKRFDCTISKSIQVPTISVLSARVVCVQNNYIEIHDLPEKMLGTFIGRPPKITQVM